MKLRYSIIALILPFLVNAQTVDTVSLNAGLTKQVYYELITGEKTSELNSDWDIAFQTLNQFSVSALINPNNGTELYLYPGDTTDWLTIDTAGLSSWTQLHNSDTSWDYGAFTFKQEHPDYGWGKYNQVTNVVEGDKVFVIKLSNGVYQKVWIKSLDRGVWTFRHATLDNSMDMEHSVDSEDYDSRNFVYFSLQNHAPRNKEPKSEEWDLYFGQYTAFVPTAYPVVGVLHSPQTTSAKAYPVNDPNTYIDWTSHDQKYEINTIGYDWKTFDMGTFSYIIADSTVYFVRTQHGDVYKLVFTHYGGKATGDIVFEKAHVHFANVEETEQLSLIELFPNPARDMVNIVYHSTTQVQLDILDVNGRVELQRTLRAADLTNNVDISNVSPGLKIVRLSSPAGVQTHKLLVE